MGQIAWVHTGVSHGVKGAKNKTSGQELDVTIYHEVMHQAGAWVNYVSHSCMQCNAIPVALAPRATMILLQTDSPSKRQCCDPQNAT